MSPTPANQDVPPEVLPLWHEGERQQGLQVHSFHQQPEVISQNAELEEGHGRLAGGLLGWEEAMFEYHLDNFSRLWLSCPYNSHDLSSSPPSFDDFIYPSMHPSIF